MLIAILAIGAIFFAGAGASLVYFHQTYPALRASLVLGKDLFVGFLTLTGIAVAAENIRRAAAAARSSVALRFVERWNEPQRSTLRDAWHKLYYELKALPPEKIVERLTRDMAERTIVADVLNFFEETAHAVNTNSADRALLERLLGETIREYYKAVSPWVIERRKTRADAWEELEACWIGQT